MPSLQNETKQNMQLGRLLVPQVGFLVGLPVSGLFFCLVLLASLLVFFALGVGCVDCVFWGLFRGSFFLCGGKACSLEGFCC